MRRQIPATMISQHPDHASQPYWHEEAFIATHNETKECFLSFSELGTSEYKWDWEGKLVDESVVERLFMEYFEFFRKHPLGTAKFLTLRLPNPNVQTEFRLGRAFMGLLSAAGLAKEIGLHTPPLFEVILPMTEKAEEMIAVQEAFAEVALLKHHLNRLDGSLKSIEVIPLFEQVQTMTQSHHILGRYLNLHRKKFGRAPEYLRPYLARSDPALNSGLVPTVLAIKIALSRYKKFEMNTGIKLFPIIGSASLPFRGGLTPETVNDFTKEYAGIKTALLQSAFRYDFDKEIVIKAIQEIEEILPKTQAVDVSGKEEVSLKEAMAIFEQYYRRTVEGIAPLVNAVASVLPRRRERVQHIGLFGYSRGVGKVKLPRAIGFTGALYSLGIPPELIGTGRGLQATKKADRRDVVEKYYVNIKKDIIKAGHFLNKRNLSRLSRKHSAWHEIMEDVKCLEHYIGRELEPETPEQSEHQKLTGEIYALLDKQGELTTHITRAAVLRKSLG